MNVHISGNVTDRKRFPLFSANLTCHGKKNSGIRHITVWTHIDDWLLNMTAVNHWDVRCILIPNQQGVGVRNSWMAAAHAVRHYLDSRSRDALGVFIKFVLLMTFDIFRRKHQFHSRM